MTKERGTKGVNEGKLQLRSINVNGPEIARGLRKTIIPFMKRTGSRVGLMDCVPVNHCPPVQAEFTDADMGLLLSAGRFHEVEGGSPPVSHDLSILDGNLFATLQSEAARKTLQALPKTKAKHSAACELMEQTRRIWKSQKYQKKAKAAVAKLPNALKAVVKEKGGPKGR